MSKWHLDTLKKVFKGLNGLVIATFLKKLLEVLYVLSLTELFVNENDERNLESTFLDFFKMV